MPYTRPYAGGFQDFPNTTTPINASALNTIDLGTKAANDQFQTVTTAQRATLTPSVGQAVWDSDLKQLMVYMNASGGNAWQPVGNRIVCASTTRPSSPFEGQEIYETDTQKTLVYSGTAWVETNDLDYSPSATVCTSSTRPTTGLFEGQRIYETDTNKEFTYSGSGWVQTNQWSTTSGVTDVNNLIVPPSASIYRTNNLTSYTSDTNIAFETEDWDTDGMVDLGAQSTRITIQTAGLYLITARIRPSGSATITRTLVKIMVNDAEVEAFDPVVDSTAARASVFSTQRVLAVNDFITVRAAITGGSAYSIPGAATEGANRARLTATWICRTS